MRSPSPYGLGIDLAEPDAFEHLDATAIERAAGRWLTPAERAWCAAQPSFRQAMIAVLSCKESAYKACRGGVAISEVAVTMDGRWPRGWAQAVSAAPEPVTLWWEASARRILTIGVAGSAHHARPLVDRIIRGRSGAESP